MSRARWTRVTAVVAAALAGGALTAYLVVPRTSGSDSDADTEAAGLTRPAASAPVSPGSSTATPPASTSAPTSGPTSAPTSGPTDGPDQSDPVTGAPATQDPALDVAAPTRVVVARLGIDMAVQPEGVTPDGQMALPSTTTVAGWYQFGRAPADGAGATVLAAHVDSKTEGVGPFVRLGSARVGDTVEVVAGGQGYAYRVTQVARIDKAKLDGDGLFAVTGPPRLHLVTCTGDYVKGSGYTQNLVVVAEPAGAG